MEKSERGLLDERMDQVRRSAWMSLSACAVGVAAIFAILGFVFWIVRRETRRRELSETSLQKTNGELGRSLEALRHYNETSRNVGLLGELLQTCRSTAEAQQIAVRNLGEMMPGTAVAVALLNPQHDGVDVTQATGDGALFAPYFRSGDCWGLRRGRPHLSHPGGFEPPCDHIAAGEQTALCIPMMAQGETLGVISLTRAGAFGEHERASIQTITEQLSLALANLKLQERLRHQSLRDPLTGLYNRRYMDEALTREVNRAARQKTSLSVAMVDIDHFKRFNDTHGHDGGDALLAAFGELMARHARSEDILCRYGGEEFAVILPGAPLEAAKARMDALRAEVARLNVVAHGRSLGPVTLSAGVAAHPRDGAQAAALLAAADAALYRAKQTGRNRVLSTDDMPAAGDAATPLRTSGGVP